MARIAFELYDPLNDYTYSMEVNPNSSNSLGSKSNYNYMAPTASIDGPIISQGMHEVRKLELSGSFLSENQYNQMLLFSARDYPWHLTDDLGREFRVICESFDPKRMKNQVYPWYHEYSWTLIVIETL